MTISVKKEFGQRNNEEVRPRCFFGAKSKQSKTAYKQTHKFYIPVFLKLVLKTFKYIKSGINAAFVNGVFSSGKVSRTKSIPLNQNKCQNNSGGKIQRHLQYIH